MGYEGNHRSGVALAMRHRLSGLSTYGLKGQCPGDEHPAYASGHDPFTLPRGFWGRKGSPPAGLCGWVPNGALGTKADKLKRTLL